MSAVSEPAPHNEPTARWSGLKTRAISAAILSLPVLGAVYAGPPFFTLLILLVAGIMGWEWSRMCDCQPSWLVVGAIYIALPCGALIWLRGGDTAGMVTIFWLFAVVWSADIGAYGTGMTFGGPKLAPRISPKKTWSGFVGGILIAGVVAATFTIVWEGDPLALALWGTAVAIASQLGDLLESAAKRHFGVKDSSSLIPGHGGVFDRVDALITGALALACLKFILGKSALPWL